MKKVHTNKILFAKTKPEAIVPTKRVEDAGYDLYACFEEEYMVIKPHETKLIPTGIATAIPRGIITPRAFGSIIISSGKYKSQPWSPRCA